MQISERFLYPILTKSLRRFKGKVKICSGLKYIYFFLTMIVRE